MTVLLDDGTNVLDASPQQQQQQQPAAEANLPASSSLSSSNAVSVGLMLVCAINLVLTTFIIVRCLRRQRRLIHDAVTATLHSLLTETYETK